ncbi:MAG: SDR family NAD(P)-dependent oxidoreductase, partial [Dietzia sp.]
MDISGKVALVTGGASGLGLATVQALHTRGASVVVVDLPSSDGETVAKELERATFAPADVADEEVWRMARELPAPSAVLLTTREKPERGGRILPVGPLTANEAARLLYYEAVRRRD